MIYISTIIPSSELLVFQSLKKTLNQSEQSPPEDCPVSDTQLETTTALVTQYNEKVIVRNTAVALQLGKTENKNNYQQVLLWFVVDFIDELNKLIRRGPFPVNNGFRAHDRKFYNLPENSSNLPDLSSETKIVHWAELIIVGEQARIAAGGAPITSPTWQEVKLWFDAYKERVGQLGKLRTDAKKAQKEITILVKQGIEVYKNGRAEMDFYYRNETDSARRDIMEIWGILYKRFGGDPNLVSPVVGFVTTEGIPLESVDVFYKTPNKRYKTRYDGSTELHELPIGITDIELTKNGYDTIIIPNFAIKPNYDNVWEAQMVMTSPVLRASESEVTT